VLLRTRSSNWTPSDVILVALAELHSAKYCDRLVCKQSEWKLTKEPLGIATDTQNAAQGQIERCRWSQRIYRIDLAFQSNANGCQLQGQASTPGDIIAVTEWKSWSCQ